MHTTGMTIQKKQMTIRVDIQRATGEEDIPDNRQIRKWVRKVLHGRRDDAELTIRIVGSGEAASLNSQWRGKKGPTNVLSFTFEDDQGHAPGLLGDIVICAPVIQKEAMEQNKPVEAHWAHMIIHGTLHLLGYDHREKAETRKMESLEIKLLDSLGYRNPYVMNETL